MKKLTSDAMRAAISRYAKTDKGKFSEAKKKAKYYIKTMMALEIKANKDFKVELRDILPFRISKIILKKSLTKKH